MRASSFVLSAVIASLSNGAVFGAPFLLKKPHAAAPVGIVSRPTVPPVSETERVELDVRHTIEPAPEPESLPAQPKPIAITRKAAETSRQGVPAAVAAPPFAALV